MTLHEIKSLLDIIPISDNCKYFVTLCWGRYSVHGWLVLDSNIEVVTGTHEARYQESTRPISAKPNRSPSPLYGNVVVG